MSNLVTGKVRFSYANVFEPRITPNGDQKYSVMLLIPKSDTTTKQAIDAEINKVLQENLADVFKGVMPANLKLPVHDGDGVRQSGEAYGAECKGHWVITANSNNAPEIVDANCNPIIGKNEFYSGCYGRASLRFYAYNQNGNKGIGCGLGNVQKLEDGQPLDGRTTAAEDFGTPYQAPIQNNPPMTGQVTPIAGQPHYQQPMQPATPGYQIDPITGMPVVPNNNFVAPQPNMMQATVNDIYGVN